MKAVDMEDIELVIKVQKAYYELVIERFKDPVLLNAFKNGIQLPKGHGRLIDAERYRKEMLDSGGFDFFNTLYLQPTIIEADI